MVMTVAVEKFAVSFDPELVAAVRDEARFERKSVSRWLAEAAEEKLRHRYAVAALEAYEREFGPITEEEMAEIEAIWPASLSTPAR